ncbi:hypothetical protein RhiirC2_447964 [Rhizophagus irregularis]|uniref:Uncharacterized protein n=1 Tax=Rhizophagus irregularis TaxID=588596 RepID=A0A2N1M3L9_9GLOM|nr:hypothetical protein RhiirC2_455648 [Rhizophagus irregularis]PKK56368.1 hypothetical protein RhiirC2_447964 [Rhizophagus irregularis]
MLSWDRTVGPCPLQYNFMSGTLLPAVFLVYSSQKFFKVGLTACLYPDYRRRHGLFDTKKIAGHTMSHVQHCFILYPNY